DRAPDERQGSRPGRAPPEGERDEPEGLAVVAVEPPHESQEDEDREGRAEDREPDEDDRHGIHERPTLAHWDGWLPRDSRGGSGGIMGIVDKIKRSLPIVGGGEAPRTTMPPRPAPQPAASAPKAEGSIHDFIDGMVKGNKLLLFRKGSPSAPHC